ncbi:MAG: MBL fold metallo-hydrolase [Gemmataceae bacterium]|nr:MBL fold metallo-hydrolase [Gemmataceae bacterium]
MALHFTVLGSGSAGNASLLESNGFGVLIDVGLGPRQLGDRLASVGASWQRAHAALLTHTHSDHWNERTLCHLLRRRIPLYCHPGHHLTLSADSPTFSALLTEGLVRSYEPGEELALAAGLTCRPFRVRHDGSVTCGFRFESGQDLFAQSSALGYVTDLGCWQGDTARALANVDVLAVEFNHDVSMQYASGRSPRLIRRVLSDEGHLSNVQAGALVREVVRLSERGRLRHLVQLHLSRDCNLPALAVAAANEALARCQPAVEVHTALQDQPGPCLVVGLPAAKATAPRPRPRSAPHAERPAGVVVQPWLPGWEG